MEIKFQQQEKVKLPPTKTTKMKAGSRNKFIGVRQRPSGRWVAEIKDTTQKIRMWLGTFESAEEAARAYDEAACLLRGSNTRTNFVTQVSSNSPLASRISMLLNNNKINSANANPKPKKKHQQPQPASSQAVESSTSTSPLFDDDVYKPDLVQLVDDDAAGGWSFGGGFLLPQAQEMMMMLELPDENSELFEFERIKVERQISASLYAINGIHDYMETVYDPTDAFWDLPPLSNLNLPS
ncbi:hypothetical protein SASPL_111236 [Salvia splendens]|uniref:AP2/ERF domain-containing protein n=1 Tax=Salvia splendens TaxID=180675 RepID=A0A8X8YAD5_SALSN|nr:ethylene-responsive transcription factor ERN1-like [Salvia splendens]KAG6426997.1 hypothetical protein SASPL_111236 [Salvia splendens]